MRVENGRLPMISMEMMLYLAGEKENRQKYAQQVADMRDGILIGLLVDIGDVFNVPIETIQSGDKQELSVLVRSIFYHIARTKTHYGIVVLAQTAGRNNHAACVHHSRKVKELFKKKDPQFLALWHHYLKHSKLFTLKDFQ